MTFVVALWLALVHALALAGPSRLAGTTELALRAGPSHAVRVERVASRQSSDATELALRASRAIDTSALARTSRSVPLRDGSPLALHRLAPTTLAAVDGQSVLLRLRDADHAVASRGSLLAYFPTAPPLQG
jgi:hypothetical protein